jgi:hypothetical protein
LIIEAKLGLMYSFSVEIIVEAGDGKTRKNASCTD